MSRVRRALVLSTCAVTSLLAACAPAPAPTAPGPAVAAPPSCDPVAAAATSDPPTTDPPASAATTDAPAAVGEAPADTDVVVVAVDAQGRPDIVTTEADRAATAARSLDSQAGVDVVAVEADLPVRTADTGGDPYRSQQWALDDLHAEAAWASSTGSGVDIAVVDTGVAGTHRDLAGRLCSGVAFLGSTGVPQAGIALAGSADSVGIAGVAPSARLIPVRVLDAAGSGSSSDVARGIVWAVDHGAEIVNLSLGGPASVAVASAVAYAEDRGVLVVAAAGNDGPTGPTNYPAAFDSALAVASYDEGGGLSWFSTRGSYVDVAAPGSGIVSTYRDGRWMYMSGTSMATPHVSGVAALLRAAEPTLTPAQLRDRITSTAIDAGPIGHDVGYGWGRVDPVAALAG